MNRTETRYIGMELKKWWISKNYYNESFFAFMAFWKKIGGSKRLNLKRQLKTNIQASHWLLPIKSHVAFRPNFVENFKLFRTKKNDPKGIFHILVNICVRIRNESKKQTKIVFIVWLKAMIYGVVLRKKIFHNEEDWP